MQIKYGISSINMDVTKICLDKLNNSTIIKIPTGDIDRSILFEIDPLPNVLKSVFFVDDDNNITEYSDKFEIHIDINIKKVIHTYNYDELKLRLDEIHNNLKLDYGSFTEEYPEQLMTLKYLSGNENVLEIGGNIGRNSLVIASILNNNGNLVTLESDSEICEQLKHNRDMNNFTFNIENSALSKRKLIQRDWDTIESDTLLNGYKEINIIDLEKLNSKYNIIFDTLVLDCEGAFYYILMDMPEILNNIKLIIMENDYWDINKKNYIDSILKQNGFEVDYSSSGGWGPCYSNFYEVWKK